MVKTQGGFSLAVEAGEFTDSEIIVMLGENGTGKTTFIRMLAGMLPPDEGSTPDGEELPQFNVSYKPQKISPKFDGTVRQLLHKKIRDAYLHPQFVSDVMKPMTIDPLLDQEVQHLSGEFFCVSLCSRVLLFLLCLGVCAQAKIKCQTLNAPQKTPRKTTQTTTKKGGELQRVALALCLGQPADIYLIDEPSAYLDVEQRILASKVCCVVLFLGRM